MFPCAAVVILHCWQFGLQVSSRGFCRQKGSSVTHALVQQWGGHSDKQEDNVINEAAT